MLKMRLKKKVKQKRVIITIKLEKQTIIIIIDQKIIIITIKMKKKEFLLGQDQEVEIDIIKKKEEIEVEAVHIIDIIVISTNLTNI
jgi:hypothetical protein